MLSSCPATGGAVDSAYAVAEDDAAGDDAVFPTATGPRAAAAGHITAGDATRAAAASAAAAEVIARWCSSSYLAVECTVGVLAPWRAPSGVPSVTATGRGRTNGPRGCTRLLVSVDMLVGSTRVALRVAAVSVRIEAAGRASRIFESPGRSGSGAECSDLFLAAWLFFHRVFLFWAGDFTEAQVAGRGGGGGGGGEDKRLSVSYTVVVLGLNFRRLKHDALDPLRTDCAVDAYGCTYSMLSIRRRPTTAWRLLWAGVLLCFLFQAVVLR